MEDDAVVATVDRLVEFVHARLLPDEQRDGFNADTRLLESGILDSLKAAILLNHIRREFGVAVPHERIDTEHFNTVRDIAVLVTDLRTARNVS